MERGRRADGISEVVGFVIILAVVMAGLSLYLTYVVPVQGREVEIKEMDSVRAWFVDYKTGMDQLWMNSPLVPGDASDIDERPSLYNATIGQVALRKVINAGTAREGGFIKKYFPVLAPLPASAEVSVTGGESFEIRAVRNGIEYRATVDAPALGYASHNYYWFQQQYYYQLGGVFLNQWDQKGGAAARNVSLIAAPPFSIYDEGGSTKVELVVVDLSAEPGGFGATSPIRVETRLVADPARPVDGDGKIWPNAFSEVDLTFRGTTSQSAEEWGKAFTGAATRNQLFSGYVPHRSGNTAWVNITGHNSTAAASDVVLEVLVADYTMRLENVPTLIE